MLPPGIKKAIYVINLFLVNCTKYNTLKRVRCHYDFLYQEFQV